MWCLSPHNGHAHQARDGDGLGGLGQVSLCVCVRVCVCVVLCVVLNARVSWSFGVCVCAGGRCVLELDSLVQESRCELKCFIFSS